MVLDLTKKELVNLNWESQVIQQTSRHGTKGSSIQVSTLEIDAIEMNRVIQWIAMKTNVLQCFKFDCERDFKLRDGASRVRNGTPGIFPSGLLAPNIPWLQLYMNIHTFTCMG